MLYSASQTLIRRVSFAHPRNKFQFAKKRSFWNKLKFIFLHPNEVAGLPGTHIWASSKCNRILMTACRFFRHAEPLPPCGGRGVLLSCGQKHAAPPISLCTKRPSLFSERQEQSHSKYSAENNCTAGSDIQKTGYKQPEKRKHRSKYYRKKHICLVAF